MAYHDIRETHIILVWPDRIKKTKEFHRKLMLRAVAGQQVRSRFRKKVIKEDIKDAAVC